MTPRRALGRFLGIAFLSIAAALWMPEGAAAQTGGERIVSYDVSMVVEDDGDLLVAETIVYDFAAAQRHGIFRDVPTRQRYDDENDRVYPLDVISVEGSPGTPVEYTTEDEGGNTRIKIGDPDQTISGQHTYEITFRVQGALNGFPDHDELYWNAVGDDWTVPVERASADVQMPTGVQQVACFAGPTGSSLPCPEATVDGRTARFSAATLSPGSALTVVVAIPTGVVPTPEPILEERWTVQNAFQLTPATMGATGGLLFAVIGVFAVLAWRNGRDRRWAGSPTDIAFGAPAGTPEEAVPLREGGETPVEFVPPDGLRPGQVGTLVDEVANPLDVTATIVDLAVRGFLRIEEIPKEGWLGKPDWRLVRLRLAGGEDALRDYERLLVDGLFQSGDEVLLSDLRDTFATRLRGVQNALYDDTVAQGWFVARPDRIRQRWTMVGVAVLVVGVGLVVLAAATTGLGLVPIPIALFGLLILIGSRWMPRRTPKGTGTLRRVLGFRRFIDESEKDRARFAERANLFSEYLPYAVVFGATDKWARAFAGLEHQVDTSWYVSPHVFTTYAFASSMEGFSVTTAGTITSTPSSSGSSGFGGGGFSGGGGGGGGGGSW